MQEYAVKHHKIKFNKHTHIERISEASQQELICQLPPQQPVKGSCAYLMDFYGLAFLLVLLHHSSVNWLPLPAGFHVYAAAERGFCAPSEVL